MAKGGKFDVNDRIGEPDITKESTRGDTNDVINREEMNASDGLFRIEKLEACSLLLAQLNTFKKNDINLGGINTRFKR